MTRKIPNTISEQEFVELLRKVKKDSHKLAFLLGFYQSMRVSEVVNLRPENIRAAEHIIEIKQSKGKKDRHIPIIKPLLLGQQEVLRALKHLPISCSIRTLERRFKEYGKKIGKDIHFHTLRHSGATWLLNKKKWDCRQVQRFLGHSKIETTMIYTHVSPQDLLELEWGAD